MDAPWLRGLILYCSSLPRISEVDDFAVDLAGRTLTFFRRGSAPARAEGERPRLTARMRVLRELDTTRGAPARGGAPRRAIVTSLPALLQPVPSRAEIAAATRTLRVGQSVDPEAFIRWLVEQGFERVTAIELPGELSMHGGILPAGERSFCRVFRDEIESIRCLTSPSATIEDLAEANVTALRCTGGPGVGWGQVPERPPPPAWWGAHLADWLPW
jgi:transcription-repair coupling factor (superfamily II helicase)